ncbi:MAG: toxin-antitoxin system HicB family antitoxin [Lentisphaeria bacterium]|jgi:predicted HicB family RNase H-like nuclease
MPPKKPRTDSEPRARLIHIRLKPETHKRLRIRAAEEDVSIQDWVAALIETGLSAPNPTGSARAGR